jgi:hypothetical protein
MKTQNFKKHLFLVLIGLLLVSATLIILHFTKMPDFVFGIFMGIGLGLMVLPKLCLLKTKTQLL